MAIDCDGGKVDLAKWAHVVSLAEALDAMVVALDIAGLTPLVETRPIFNQSTFVNTSLEYTWIFVDGVTDPCNNAQIDDHFLTTDHVFTAEEQWAMEQGRLYFIGASATTTANANAPCYCCLVGKVIESESGHELVNSDRGGSCTNAMNFSSPCTAGKNLLNANYLANHKYLTIPRNLGAEVGGFYQVVRELCAGATDSVVYYYKWVVANARYEIAKVKIVKLWGYFGWNVSADDFNAIKDRIVAILAASCGAQAEKFYLPGTTTWIELGEPVSFNALMWTLLQLDPNTDPGCVQSVSAGTGVTLPWVAPTCGAVASDCGGQMLYCNTLKHLETIIAKLGDLYVVTDPCPECVLHSIERRNKGGSFGRIGYPQFTGPTKYFRTAVSHGWGYATIFFEPTLAVARNALNCSLLYSFSPNPGGEYIGFNASKIWESYEIDDNSDGITTDAENAASLRDEFDTCDAGFDSFHPGGRDVETAAYVKSNRYNLMGSIPDGLPIGEVFLLNEITNAEFLQNVRDYVFGLSWPEAPTVGGTPTSTYADTGTLTLTQYRWRFPVPPDSAGLQITWDIVWTPAVGTPSVYDTPTWQWDRATPGGYTPGTPATYPTTPWFDLPEPTENGSYSVSNVRIHCGADQAPVTPGAVTGYAL